MLDKKIVCVDFNGITKLTSPSKTYLFQIQVTWSDRCTSTIIKCYEDFIDLQMCLSMKYPGSKVPSQYANENFLQFVFRYADVPVIQSSHTAMNLMIRLQYDSNMLLETLVDDDFLVNFFSTSSNQFGNLINNHNDTDHISNDHHGNERCILMDKSNGSIYPSNARKPPKDDVISVDRVVEGLKILKSDKMGKDDIFSNKIKILESDKEIKEHRRCILSNNVVGTFYLRRTHASCNHYTITVLGKEKKLLKMKIMRNSDGQYGLYARDLMQNEVLMSEFYDSLAGLLSHFHSKPLPKLGVKLNS